jgi:hypothetical protein
MTTMNNVARIIIFACFLFAANGVFGCSCGSYGPSEGFDRAQAVFTATVVKAKKAEWLVSIERVWKGDVEPQIVLHDANPGSSCAFHFLRGVTYLFLIDVKTSNGVISYYPQVCNWTNRLKSDRIRFDQDGPYRLIEDWVLAGRGDGNPPSKRRT